MHRTLLSLGTAGAAALATAAPALATPAPPPDTYTGGQLVPPALIGAAEYVFGSHYAKQLPTGAAALVWNLTLVAGETTDLTMGCPAGTVVADLNITGPSTGSGETTQLPAFTPWYGQNAPSVSFGTTKPGPLTWGVLCLPAAKASTTVVHGRSPVTFAPAPLQMDAGVKQGTKLPKGSSVLRSTTTGTLSAGGTYVTMSRSCAGGTYPSTSVVTSPGSGGTSAFGPNVILYPSTRLGSGPVTVYVLCSPPPKPQP